MNVNTDCVVQGTLYKLYCQWKVPRLFRYADEGNWGQIPARCRRRPSEARFVHKYAPADTPLHRLLRPLVGDGGDPPCPAAKEEEKEKAKEDQGTEQQRVDEEFKEEDPVITGLLLDSVEAILRANPKAAVTSNMFGRTPLHLACMEQLTPARISAATYLVRHQPPMIASLRDQFGKTPFHYLIQARIVPTDDRRAKHNMVGLVEILVRALLKADSKALERRDNQGQTVLDCIQQKQGRFDVSSLPMWKEILNHPQQ